MSDRKTEEPRLEGSDEDTSWSYRGYRVASGGFATAMVHFYRGEISRANIWRSRLDTTTNWAVVTAGAVITFSFGAAGNTHVVILLGMFLILQFLMMESRRYRYYGHCQRKVARTEFSTDDRELGRPELTPLGECGGAVELEIVS